MSKQNSRHQASLARGQVLVAAIESLAAGGEGVTRQFGLPVFANRVCPGDLVELEIFDVRKDFARARLLRVLEPSNQRVEPPCKIFKVCGGCQWQHVDYQWQLAAKTDIVRQAVRRIGGLDPVIVQNTLGAELDFFYRNKVQFPVANPHNSDRLLAGYYQQDSHELVNIKHCPVQPGPLDNLLATVKEICQKHKISACDEIKHTGVLRHIAGRYSFAEQAILLTLVVNAFPPGGGQSKMPPVDLEQMSRIAAEIISAQPEVTGVCLNFNPQHGNKIMGDETICLSGQSFIREKLATSRADLPPRLQQGIAYKLSPTSFFQIHSRQAVLLMEKIYDAVEMAGARQAEPLPLIVDAYAGVGAIALWLSPLATRIIAVEEHSESVADGLFNVQMNKIENVSFRQGQVENVLDSMKAEALVPDVLVVDPPRKGLSAQSIECLFRLNPANIVYVSCNPATLARDLKKMEINGYKTKQIQPVDMFPQTYHVETVTLLTRQ